MAIKAALPADEKTIARLRDFVMSCQGTAYISDPTVVGICGNLDTGSRLTVGDLRRLLMLVEA